jgi:hypothetical protein
MRENFTDSVTVADPAGLGGSALHRALGSPRAQVLAATALVFALYALPIVLALSFQHRLPNIIDYDDRLYLGRIVDAYFGGSLGNTYLAGHEDAPKYIPELAERMTAAAAHAVHISPFVAAALNRVWLPTIIFLLCWRLGRVLGLADDLAVLAGLLTVLMPSVTRSTGTYMGDILPLGFLRYFSAISPPVYVFLLLAALLAVARLWSRPTPARAAVAAVALGLLFYGAPPHFWSFGLGGAILLALASSTQIRRELLAAVAGAAAIGSPHLVRAWRLNQMPEVQQTLHRTAIMLPGRMPEPVEFVMCGLTLALAAVVFVTRRRIGAGAAFYLAYLLAGAMLLVQRVVTNRQIQDFHFGHCIVPVAYLAIAAAGAELWRRARPAFRTASVIALFAAGFAIQVLGYQAWERADTGELSDMYHLEAHIPRTIAWLHGHGSGKVVIASSLDRMEALADFAHVKVYWSPFAYPYVISDAEADLRSTSYDTWQHDRSGKLPYLAQLFVGIGDECRNGAVRADERLYSNPQEATCVLALSGR